MLAPPWAPADAAVIASVTPREGCACPRTRALYRRALPPPVWPHWPRSRASAPVAPRRPHTHRRQAVGTCVMARLQSVVVGTLLRPTLVGCACDSHGAANRSRPHYTPLSRLAPHGARRRGTRFGRWRQCRRRPCRAFPRRSFRWRPLQPIEHCAAYPHAQSRRCSGPSSDPLSANTIHGHLQCSS